MVPSAAHSSIMTKSFQRKIPSLHLTLFGWCKSRQQIYGQVCCLLRNWKWNVFLEGTLTPVCCSLLSRQGACCDLDIMYIIGVYTNCSSPVCTIHVYYYPKKSTFKNKLLSAVRSYIGLFQWVKYFVSNWDYSSEQLLPLKDRPQTKK